MKDSLMKDSLVSDSLAKNSLVRGNLVSDSLVSSSQLKGALCKDSLLKEAGAFIETCYAELNKSKEEINRRLREVADSIYDSGTYTHTYEELEYGARMAWRNNSRCIGRLFWKSLHVLDQRQLTDEASVMKALLHHLDYATNGGKVLPAISVFKPQTEDFHLRIWNHQLIRYAGYETSEGILGDPHSLAFTRLCTELGWSGRGTAYDVLPLVVQLNERPPIWMEIPKTLIKEVSITHPVKRELDALNLRWYGVPFISDMRMVIGGLQYTAAPFNGWYMVTEIAARNLADEQRYNVLPLVAEAIGLDTSSNHTFWKDKALVELNEAVYHSFREHKVSIVDHHTAAEQFAIFERQEEEQGREVNGRWSWLIPPLSPATTAVWHKAYQERKVSPNYEYQEPKGSCPFSK
ncbi:nitric oxide synthase oxygenase [Paenibacillus senegalensis]|uniref:nitric oxide synthase oxygenase n=1 Tax=Paenibacillus senegalensis TaxID=1465766 RepID=UPI0002899FF4